MCSSAVHGSNAQESQQLNNHCKSSRLEFKKGLYVFKSNPQEDLKFVLLLFFFSIQCVYIYTTTHTCMCTHVQTSVLVVLLAASVDSLMYHLRVASTTKVIHKNKKCTVHAITCICHSKQELLQAKITGY